MPDVMRGGSGRLGRMNEPKKLIWPVWVLVLDFVGMFLVAVGIYALVATGPLPFADTIDLRALAIPLIIIGALMFAPLILMTLAHIRGSR